MQQSDETLRARVREAWPEPTRPRPLTLFRPEPDPERGGPNQEGRHLALLPRNTRNTRNTRVFYT